MKVYEGLIMSAAVWAVCEYALDQWASQPVIQLTFPDGDCVRVISEDPTHTCTHRPEIYSVQWVDSKLLKGNQHETNETDQRAGN